MLGTGFLNNWVQTCTSRVFFSINIPQFLRHYATFKNSNSNMSKNYDTNHPPIIHNGSTKP